MRNSAQPNIRFLATWMLAFMMSASMNAQLVLNEICVDNEEFLADVDGDFPDWVELFNNGKTSVNLLGWSLSDDADNLQKWTFPDYELPPSSFMVVFASGKNRMDENQFHTSFKLDEGNEHCFLVDPSGQMVSAFQSHLLPADLSFGKMPDALGDAFYFATPTPGFSNNQAEVEFFDENDMLSFSAQGGFYNETFALEIHSTNNEVVIHYTEDGSPSDERSAVYVQPIALSTSLFESEGNAYVATSESWIAPEDGVRKVKVIRATPYIHNVQAGPEVVHTYFIGQEMKVLYPEDVVSLTIQKDDFFSDSIGIYVHGDALWGNFTGRGMAWERKVFMEYFSDDEASNMRQSVGARIHGRSSRYSPQKTLRLHARERYGKGEMTLPALHHPSNDDYKELLLRAPEPLFSTSLFTDELVQTVISHMDIDVQAQRAVVLFINGEYWGLHHVRERLDEHYLEQHYGVNEENVDILDWDSGLDVQEGDDANYKELISFLQSHDLNASENYEVVRNWVDVPSFIDYMVAQLFFANEDFTKNNVRLWREKEEGAKWRFFFFDADATMREHWQNRLPQFLADNTENDPISIIFSSLLKNEEFKQAFGATFIHHLSTTFSPDNIIAHIEEFEDVHAPMVAEHIRRWNRPQSLAEWHNAMQAMTHFAIMRPPTILEYLNEYFPHPFDVFPNPAHNKVNLRFLVFSEEDIPKVMMTDIAGATVTPHMQMGGNIMEMDVSALSAGIYLLQVDMGKMTYSEKLIITQ